MPRFVANEDQARFNPGHPLERFRSTRVVQCFRKAQVIGSSPIGSSIVRVAQPVEQLICNQKVAGATPAAGSKDHSRVAERRKHAAVNRAEKSHVGSNPTPGAKCG